MKVYLSVQNPLKIFLNTFSWAGDTGRSCEKKPTVIDLQK